MTTERTDRANRVIAAAPNDLYDAFLDPAKLVQWLPPGGMSGNVHALEPVEGGVLRLSLYYDTAKGTGKTTAREDAIKARFHQLVRGRKIALDVEFESDDPQFSGTMRQVWTFEPSEGGTEVVITCTNVPEGITAEAHAAGLDSALANLVAFAERDAGTP